MIDQWTRNLTPPPKRKDHGPGFWLLVALASGLIGLAWGFLGVGLIATAT